MSGFFDPAPTPGTNRHADQTACETCGGDRLIETEPDVYARCHVCNPASTTEREPVKTEAWWKE